MCVGQGVRVAALLGVAVSFGWCVRAGGRVAVTVYSGAGVFCMGKGVRLAAGVGVARGGTG